MTASVAGSVRLVRELVRAFEAGRQFEREHPGQEPDLSTLLSALLGALGPVDHED